MITIVGLLINALSLFWLLFERLYYGRASFSTYIYCGVSLFIYQVDVDFYRGLYYLA